MNKTKYLILLITVITMTSIGCRKLAGLLDVTFNTTYSVELEAIVPPSTTQKQTEGTFTASATVDPNSNANFLKYADKIKGVQIISISAKVLSISKALTIQSASISVNSETKHASWNFTNELMSVGKILSLGNESNQWIIVQDILNEKNIFTILVDGHTDVDDVEFTIEVTINAKITANPIGN